MEVRCGVVVRPTVLEAERGIRFFPIMMVEECESSEFEGKLTLDRNLHSKAVFSFNWLHRFFKEVPFGHLR